VSLDHPLRETGGGPLAELLADEGAVRPDQGLEDRARRDLLDARLAVLPEREERVLRLYFGLGDGRPRGLGEIAGRLKVSRERVRQIKARALSRLRSLPPERA